jgi:hypothetical protein
MTKKGMYRIDMKDGLYVQTAGDGFETDCHIIKDTSLVIFGDTMVNQLDIKIVTYTSSEDVAKENQ